ncbi:MAG: ATP-binding cassette domain-containing protein [Anaerolineae bacterium]|jgi:ABC-2 type transport system ATP-binding protein|nr:ATP-binding cassette domain-containing protein [Anaerolineae bacterium]MDH7475375.1 ATP-binding cassette domain-containing protein [Anaerolineae bacterium]
MVILKTEALTRRFGPLTAVDALMISVEAGEVFGLLGPNGAGKTTTIKMLTTLLPPTEGSAQVAGFDIVRQAADVRRCIGYVPQLLSADGSLTGYENLLIFAKLYDIPRTGREERVREALAFMGLSDAADKLVRNYSGGMIRRLEIAQSMLHRPQVLFLDEPTIGLDPLARKLVWEYIEKLRTQYGTTIFLTTHLMEEADKLCSRVAIMHLGKIGALGTPAELKDSIGGNGATLDDVFIHYTSGTLESGGSYRETSRTRRTARRLG